MTAEQSKRAQQIAQAFAVVLKENGIPLTQLNNVLLQVAHETGGFKSRMSTYNNMSGIKYRSKTAIKGESDSGVRSPEGDNYSKFDTVGDWAKRHFMIVNRGANKPVLATTPEDYAFRLKANKYYTDTLQNYTKGLLSWQPQINKLSKPIIVSAVLILLVLVTFLTITYNV